MHRIENLITGLCPNGVPFTDIKSVAEVGTGSSNGNEADENGLYPFFIRSKTVKLKCSYEYDEEAIIIPGEGGVGEIFHYINGKYALHQRVYRIHFTEPSIDTRFVYYYMEAFFKKFILRKAVSATVTSIRKPMIESFQIPVPPLEVQQEIVRILDHFTELTTELTAELAAREKQHQYYTQHLYDSIKEKGVPVVCVKDVCDLLTGFPFDSSHFVSEGIHLLRGMNIKRGFLDYSDGNNRYWNTVKGYEKFLLADDDIVIAMDGSLVGKSYGQVKKQHLPVLLVQRVTRVRATKINAHYLYHYISSGAFTKYVEQKKTGGAVPHISMKDIENFTLPLPPEKLQEEISEVLDRFDALCNDLTSGLPAEIAARQKQYEYYRDKLLTFKKREG